MAGGGAVCDSVRVAVPALHGHCVALSRGLRAGRNPHAAGGAAGWVVDGGGGAVLRRGDDSGEPGAVEAGHDGRGLSRDCGGAGAVLSRLYDPLRAHPADALGGAEPVAGAGFAEGERDLSATADDGADAVRDWEALSAVASFQLSVFMRGANAIRNSSQVSKSRPGAPMTGRDDDHCFI